MVFYVGSVSMATKLKFEVFDVFDRKEHKMNPIGQAQCKVMELLMSVEQIQRLQILFDGVVCGFLTVRAWRVSCVRRGVAIGRWGLGEGVWLHGGVFTWLLHAQVVC